MTYYAYAQRQHPIYEANQVLSSSHLNQMQAFLEQADAMTNAYGIGTGWLNGAETSITLSGAKLAKISITCSTGITSQGLMAVFEGCELEYARAYVDPYIQRADDEVTEDIQGYGPFWTGTGANRKQKTIWELLTADEVKDYTDAEIEAMKIPKLDITAKDWVMVVYVEWAEEDIRSCVLEDCNDRGRKMLVNIRKLLVKKSEIDAPAQQNPYDQSGLEHVWMRRVLDLNVANVDDLAANYSKVCEQVIKPLSEMLEKTCERTKKYLGAEAPISAAELQEMLQKKRDAIKSVYIQLYYDFLRDLTSAVNEFMGLSACIRAEGCLDEDAFPRHLLVRELVMDKNTKTPVYRHYFHGPAYPSLQDKAVMRLRQMLAKIRLMLKAFDPKTIPQDDVRILPQREVPSSPNTIPYYYDLKQYPELAECWNAEPITYGAAYHYRAVNMGDDTNRLLYNIDNQEMFRIEGHLGGKADDVMQKLEQLKSENRLAFDLVQVQLSDVGAVDYTALCHYAEMEYDFAQQRTRILSILREVAASIRAVSDDFPGWIGFSAQVFPDVSALEKALQVLINQLTSRLVPFNAANFNKAWREMMEQAATYQALLGRLAVQITMGMLYQGVNGKLVSVSKPATSYYMLPAIAIAQMRERIGVLFILLDINSILAVAKRFKYAQYELEKNHPDAFATFISKHEGVEHIAGVTKGGTFILLADKGQVVGDFYLPYLCCGSCEGENSYHPSAEIYTLYFESEWRGEVELFDANLFGEEVTKFAKKGMIVVNDEAALLPGKPVQIDDYGNMLQLNANESGALLISLIPSAKQPDRPISFSLGIKSEKIADTYYCWVALRPPLIVANDDQVVAMIRKPITFSVIANDLFYYAELAAMAKLNVKILVPPKKGALAPAKEGGIGSFTYTPQVDRQGLDYCTYSLSLLTEYGVTIESQARITFHIVECCEETSPVEEAKPEVSLPRTYYAKQDLNRYFFRIVGEAKVLPQAGVVFVEKGGETSFTRLGALSLLPAREAGSIRSNLGTRLIDTGIIRGDDLDDVKAETGAPAFVPSDQQVTTGKKSLAYTTTEDGVTKNGSLVVFVVSLPDDFTVELDWKTASPTNPGGAYIGAKFSYAIDPIKTAAIYSWDFGDNSAVSNEQAPGHNYSIGRSVTVTLTVTLKEETSISRIITKTIRLYQVSPNDTIRAVESARDSLIKMEDNNAITAITSKDERAELIAASRVLPVLALSMEGEAGAQNLKEGKLDKTLNDTVSDSLKRTEAIAIAKAEENGADAVKPIVALVDEQAKMVTEFTVAKNAPLTADTKEAISNTVATYTRMKESGISVLNPDLAKSLEASAAASEHADVKAELKKLIAVVRK